jgi:excisionase family DNA binding protein
MVETNGTLDQLIDKKRLLKPGDVAGILNISRSFAYHLLETRQLPTVRIGRTLRVRAQDLEAYIEANLIQENKSE